MINLWPLLLPVATVTGWWMARRQDRQARVTSRDHLSREYVVGLNYLLNEQADKAVDIFIKLLEVDSETVETHLALGSLFRRRGEVDRAIRIHQNLIARPQLSQYQRIEALMALGQDYMSAGVFDRAERIFQEVAALEGDKKAGSLLSLLDIYQREKAWEKAIDVITKLEATTGNSMRVQIAHYYCELAEKLIKNKQVDKATAYLKQALSMDRASVRASILHARLDMMQGKYKSAIKSLKRVKHQDPDYLSEIVEPMVECYAQTAAMEDCFIYLSETIKMYPRASVIFVLADYLKQKQGVEKAIDFVSEQLSSYPSIRGLNQLIQWHIETTYGKVRDKLEILYDITVKLLENKPVYRCGQCGFAGKHLHWQCPSCKKWNTIKPIHGLEGD